MVVGEYANNDMNVLWIWKNNATVGIDKSYTGEDKMIGMALKLSLSRMTNFMTLMIMNQMNRVLN